ncbi:MAG: adenylate/guanylate cyclase domain-containing protein [Patescibacteria group bacterium]
MSLFKKYKYFLIPILVSFLLAISLNNGTFSNLENIIEDQLFAKQPLDSQILIVAIDDASIGKYGQWPWPRALFASFFEKLKEAPPRSVALDVMFSEKSRLGEADDMALEETFLNIPYKLIMPVEIRSQKEIITPLAQYLKKPNVYLGHVNLILDNDGVVRKYKPIQKYAGKEYYSFGLVSFIEKLPQEYSDEDIRIVYATKPGAIRRISFKDALERENSFFKDKIIFVGATAPDLHDEQQTPVSKGKLMSGVEIQANIANAVLSNLSLTSIPLLYSYILFFILALLSSLTFNYLKNIRFIFIANFVLVILLSIFGVMLFENGLAINFIHSLGTIILTFLLSFAYRYAVLDKEKREVRKIFEKYVSPQVLQKIMENPEKVALGGEEKKVTVLFSDIRGFTTLSEATEPGELVGILNEYFTEMTNEVLKYGGVLDKYIGDAVMAFWGAPLEDVNQEDNAVLAGIGMIKALKKFNKTLVARGKPEIKNGVGIYSGRAIVGNVGSKDRFDYTVIGDTVNTASRLESATKEFGVSIIIGEPTYKSLKNKLSARKLGTTKVKGKIEELHIYTIDTENVNLK